MEFAQGLVESGPGFPEAWIEIMGPECFEEIPSSKVIGSDFTERGPVLRDDGPALARGAPVTSALSVVALETV